MRPEGVIKVDELLATLAFVTIVALWVFLASSVRRFECGYQFDGEFQGNLYECVITGFYSETSDLCWIGANRSHLLLLSHPKGAGSWLGFPIQHQGLDKNLSISWREISFRPRKLFFSNSVWFELQTSKTGFSVPREVAEKVLADAGRELPRR
jgi:hypothetical protein